MKRKPTVLSPAKLLAKANALPPGVALSDYDRVMWTLKNQKGFSLRQIAAWLTAELHVPITHMQVYRAMQAALPEREHYSSEEEAQKTEDLRDELDEEAQK